MERKTAHYRRLIQIFAYLMLRPDKIPSSTKAHAEKASCPSLYAAYWYRGMDRKMTFFATAVCLLVVTMQQS